MVDAVDMCPGTVVDAFTDLKANRYSYNGTALVSQHPNNAPYTMAQTGGRSGAQIIAAMGMGVGQERMGLLRPKLEVWVAAVPDLASTQT